MGKVEEKRQARQRIVDLWEAFGREPTAERARELFEINSVGEVEVKWQLRQIANFQGVLMWSTKRRTKMKLHGLLSKQYFWSTEVAELLRQ